MMDFTQPWEFGDATFIVEDKKIYANKVVLSLYSEVFRTMFTSEFAEKKMTEIPLPDKKFDDFLQLMQILHPPHDKCVDDTNVECVLPLAHEYQIHHVVEKCESLLVKQPPSIHNLILADKFSLTKLREVCIEYIKDIQLQKLDKNPEFKAVELESLAEIYRMKLELKEDSELSKKDICNLMSEPPSIKNLFLAEKYEVPQVYEKCLNYLKDTPLSQLKAEAGFTNLKPDTVIDVLRSKVEKLETRQTEVSNIASWVILEPQISHYRHNILFSTCSRCTPYRCTNGNDHFTGRGKDCSLCKAYRFDKLCESVKKY